MPDLITTEPEEQLTVTLSATAARAVRYAANVGLPPDKLVETAILNWITKNNLAHVLLALPKVEKPPKPPKAPPAPKPPKVRPPKHPATILGLMRNAPAGIIIFEVRRLGCAIDRVRFSGWNEDLDARVQLAPVVPVQGMTRWDDLVGRTVDIKPSSVPGQEGTLVARPAADLEADLDWLEGLDLDEADRAALAKLRGQG